MNTTVDEDGIQMEICRVCGDAVYALIKDDICAPCDKERAEKTLSDRPLVEYPSQEAQDKASAKASMLTDGFISLDSVDRDKRRAGE